MDFKQISYDLKDLDENKGIVVAYANVYNVKDVEGDISAPGSFTKSVKENFNRIKVLKDHDKRVKLGVPLEIDTKDTYGLLTTTQFNMSKEVSRDMFTDIKLEHETGRNSELSIGYKIAERDVKNKSIIKQYKLWEYSFLTAWGVNSLSTVQGVKGLNTTQEIIDLIIKSYDLDYSDNRLRQIEAQLKALTSGPSDDTFEIEPLVKTISNFRKELNGH